MCGIIAFVSATEKENPAHFLLDGLKRLEYRGYDSWGIAYGANPVLAKKAGRISHIEAEDFVNKPALAGLGHTRWATHGGVTDENAHPHTDCKGKIVVVHNGIVENWEELKNGLMGRGHNFKSETDTEVIAHLIEEEVGEKWEEERFVEAVRGVFNKLDGLNAIVAYAPQLGAIVGFRNGSPMVLGVGEGEHFIASDIPAFLPSTRRVSYLSDGEGVILTGGKAEVLEASTGRRSAPKVEEISWEAGEAELGEYPHYLIKEISEQPQILSRLSKYPEKEIKEVAKLIKDSFGTYFTACGTAAHSGLAATYMFADLAERHVNFSVGSEFPFLESFLTPESLLIAASQSGETMDTLEAVRAAKKHKAKVVALTNVQGSSLTRVADKTLLLNCGPEKAVLATKSYTAKLALFLLLASQIGRKGEEGRKLIAKAARGVKEILAEENILKIKDLAKDLKDSRHIYVIGRGVNYPTALEAALKIKEVTYIHAEGFAGGELKHGVIALIEKGTPCLVFVANDQTKDSVLSNAKEIKSRGAYVIGVAPQDNEVFDSFIKVADVGLASPIVNAVPAQLLAYYLAVERGLDPDKPRNLAKSVTVK
ncbi:MAG: Glucosamine/fructose-6-phosphate aminotransferase, isomerizing [candidate division CPR1 bacterium GW2011_GWC1_49_13]|uniref:Glutamine--fructose-6-phosphate aminotransferase [isomerizing] n=1 Tax=candidate division CPR1 bacterium GW2011_GWC1_49_13 TaxID=1618342 RepID=A0A0G1YIG5_9BACT|nr:MAG: Glucosamine/fructose-6-phosphate aminotransferase, isomerizing [candidate division CPR1 bacterium GW2011_GWC1_49_13]